MSDLRPAAETAVLQCLDLDSNESCLIVTDDELLSVGEALYDVAADVTDDAIIIRYPPGSVHGGEPPEPVSAAMERADVVLAPTTTSLSHTNARRGATAAGARVATLPDITEEVFVTGVDTDYDVIAEHCETVYEQVKDANEIRVRTDRGTDITFTIGDREFIMDTGIVHESGGFSNLPAGEVFVSPESGDGVYIVDGSIFPHGLIEEPIEIEVEDGFITSISDETIRERVEDAAKSVGDRAYNLAELGIGTNVAVTELVGNVLLDEKAAGTVHIAIGDDAGIGGDVDAPLHIDGVIRNPEITVDGRSLAVPK